MVMWQKIRRVLSQMKWRVETIAMLAAARFLVRYVAFRYWRKLLGPIDGASSHLQDMQVTKETENKAVRVGRSVRSTARKVPFEAVCLPQAMAGRWMLSRRGVSTRLFIGARRNQETALGEFHAWLMHGDICLTGQLEKDEFQTFGKDGDLHALS